MTTFEQKKENPVVKTTKEEKSKVTKRLRDVLLPKELAEFRKNQDMKRYAENKILEKKNRKKRLNIRIHPSPPSRIQKDKDQFY